MIVGSVCFTNERLVTLLLSSIQIYQLTPSNLWSPLSSLLLRTFYCSFQVRLRIFKNDAHRELLETDNDDWAQLFSDVTEVGVVAVFSSMCYLKLMDWTYILLIQTPFLF